jgi:hypothetical protein
MTIPFKGKGSCFDAAPPGILGPSFYVAIAVTLLMTLSGAAI